MAVFSSSTVSQDDIVRTQESVRALLKTRFPNLSFIPGSDVDQLFVQSTAYIVSLFLAEAEEVRSRLSVNSLLARTDNSGTRALEDLASNWLVDLRSSESSRGVIFIEVSSPSSFIIPRATQFTRAEGLTVETLPSLGDITVNASDFSSVTSTDGITVYRYSTLAQNSGILTTVATSPGTFTTQLSIPNLIQVFNSDSFIPPVQTSTEDLVSRLRSSVTKRGFSTATAVKATLQDNSIPGFLRAVSIGAGDKEMYRDLNRAISDPPIHTLGMANIVAFSRITTQNFPATSFFSTTFTDGFSLVQKAQESSSDLYFVSFFAKGSKKYRTIRRFLDVAGSTVTTTEVTNETLSAGQIRLGLGSYWNSVYAHGKHVNRGITLSKSITQADPTSITVVTTPVVQIIQRLIDSEDYRPLGQSTESQASVVSTVILPAVRVIRATGVQVQDISRQLIINTLINTVNNWAGHSTISYQDIISPVAILLAGLASSVSLSGPIVFVVHLPDMRDLVYSTQDSLDIEDTSKQVVADLVDLDTLYSMQVSNRVLQHRLLESEIAVEIV